MAEKQHTIRYTPAIVAIITLLLLFLGIIDRHILADQREMLLNSASQQATSEVKLVGEFVTEPLLRHEFGLVENFLTMWSSNNQDVVQLTAIAPNDFHLTDYQRSAAASHVIQAEHRAEYAGQHLVTLRITKDLGPVEKRLAALQRQLIGYTGLVAAVLGVILWFTLKRLALQPLEQEIARRQQAENRALEAYNELNQIFDTAADGMRVVDKDHNVLRVNSTLARMTGCSREELLAKKCHELFPGPFCHTEHCSLTRILSGEQRLDIELERIRPDGTQLPCALTVTPYHDPKGDLLGIVENFKDITERKQAEKQIKQAYDDLENRVRERTAELSDANTLLQQEISEREKAEENLRQARKYLKNIIDSMPSILVGVDENGTITQWNTEAEKRTGLSVRDALGQPFDVVLPDLADQLDMVQRAIQDKQPLKSERLAQKTNGEIHYLDLMVYPLVANGAMGAVVRVDDVTTRVRIEDMMVQTEKMMSVGGLAAGMAHEINNPLGGILQGVQNITRRLSPDLAKNASAARECGVDLEKLQGYLQQRDILRFLEGIRESGAKAAKIVGDMLNFSRQSTSEFALVDLAEIIEKTITLATSDYDLKKNYDFKQIEIVREFAPDLPKVPCEETKIEQVILNLLKNSAQAMTGRTTTGPPRIILRTRKSGDMLCIEVEDNGCGMDEATRKRVFEPFFTTKEVQVGTGLGLSVSYFIITDNHKGRMEVESAPGQGAKFTLHLPRQKDAT